MAAGENSAEIRNFIGYCLAYAAQKYHIQIHASVWMSNHHHTDVTDPYGNLPQFKQQLHSLIARGLNAKSPTRHDTFWSGDGGCDTRRSEDEFSLGDLVYTLTNPVKDGLVKRSELWPSFTTINWKFGEVRTFRRPRWFFDEDGDMPEQVDLTLVRPDVRHELDDEALFDEMMADVRAKEAQFQDEMRRSGKRFMGLRKLAKQRHDWTPPSEDKRFNIAPKYAASSRLRVWAQLQRDREWERQYAIARESLLAGGHPVFPAGTYFLRRFAGVAVAPQPPP